MEGLVESPYEERTTLAEKFADAAAYDWLTKPLKGVTVQYRVRTAYLRLEYCEDGNASPMFMKAKEGDEQWLELRIAWNPNPIPVPDEVFPGFEVPLAPTLRTFHSPPRFPYEERYLSRDLDAQLWPEALGE